MSSLNTRAVRFHQTGDASVLKIESVVLPAPAKDQVRIKVQTIGVNRAEVMFRNGAYLEAVSYTHLTLPTIYSV